MDFVVILTVICATYLSAALGFTGGDDRFMKKYAMMKVYESCFGPEVVKEVRKEMKLATAKCNGMMPTTSSIYSYQPPSHQTTNKYQTQSQTSATVSSSLQSNSPFRLGSGSTSNFHTQATAYNVAQQRPALSPLSESTAQQLLQAASSLSANDQLKSSSIDLNKLQQVILSGMNKQSAQQQQQPQMYTSPLLTRPPSSALSYQSSSSQIRPFVQYQQPLQTAHSNLVYHNIPSINPATQLTNDLFQAPASQAQPIYAPQPIQQSPYPFMYQNAFYPQYYSPRASRDLDIKGQLETLTTKLAGKVKNVTCVMQELGYLDENLEPDYIKMVERINRLPISNELKSDMAEGVNYCRQFSQCVPDTRKDKLAKEMLRPMFFFRCYKHKKLEACIMKDIRERYSAGNEDLVEDSIISSGDMRSMKNKGNQALDDEHMEVAIYEFLYGGDTSQLDSLL